MGAFYKFNLIDKTLGEQVGNGKLALQIPYEPELLELYGEDAILEEGVHFNKELVYKPGSEVTCMFGDAGHKFWFKRGEVMTVIRTKSDGRAPYRIYLMAKNGEVSDFYSNDFRMVSGVQVYMAYSTIDVEEKCYSFSDIKELASTLMIQAESHINKFLIGWAINHKQKKNVN